MKRNYLRYIVGFILFVGISMRFAEYSVNRSLSFDEANIAFKINAIPFQEMIRATGNAFPHMQPLPVGFIFILKLMGSTFGDYEYVWRLTPLICGIIALFLFLKLAKEILSPKWAVAAFGLFAVSRDLIYYSSEVKPYSSDVMIALILMIIFYPFMKNSLSLKMTLVVGIFSSILIWFSFPSIIILASLGGFIIYTHVRRRDWSQVSRWLSIVGMWGISMFIYYMFSIRHYLSHNRLNSYWEDAFMPLNQGVIVLLQWLTVVFNRVFWDDLQIPGGLAAVAFIAGVVFLSRKSQNAFRLLTLPIILTLLMSSLKLYPFRGRVIVFLLPSFILLIFYGLKILSEHKNEKFSKVIAVILTTFIFFYPITYSIRQATATVGEGEIKPVMQYIKEHKLPDDNIAIYYASLTGFRYYAPQYGFNDRPYLITKTKAYNFIESGRDLEDLLAQKRVWIIFTHLTLHKNVSKRLLLLKRFDKVGNRVDQYEVKMLEHSMPRGQDDYMSASAYLYEFGNK